MVRAPTFFGFNTRSSTDFFLYCIDSKRGTALACTGIRNKHTLAGMVPNQKYFVDIFGVHKKVPGLIFKLAATSLVFNSSSPIELREDQTEFGKLTEFDKRSSFVFKVNINEQKLGACSTISMILVYVSFIFHSFLIEQLNNTQNMARAMFLIIPCDQSVKVKVTSLKKLRKVVDVTSAMILKFNHLKENDRVLVKFFPMRLDEGMQRSK